MLEAFDQFWALLSSRAWGQLAAAGWLCVGLGSLALWVWDRPAARGPGRRLWVGLGVLGPLLALEMPVHLRFRLTDLLRRLVASQAGAEAVAGRRTWQMALIAVAGVVIVGVLAAFLWSSRRWSGPARLGGLGLGVGLTGFVLEIISLHQIDAHYGIYWSIWFSGLAIQLAAVAWAAVADAPGGGVAARPPLQEILGHRTYHVGLGEAGHAVSATAGEGLGPRFVRLGLLALILALPEVARWLSGR